MSPGYARRTILVVAAVLGLITATLVYVYVSRVRQGTGQMVYAVVAAEFISARTVISPNMVEMKRIPASDVKPDTAVSFVQVRQRVTVAPIEKGEPISITKLADKSAVFGLAAIIPRGTRAMTISVDATDIVPGFLQPGERVDIIASFVEGSDSVAKTILQNIPLLAVNENLTPLAVQQGEKPKAPASSQTSAQPTATLVTIAVTPPEAERLVAAQYKGKLKLGLRGMGDNSRVETLGANTSLMAGTARTVIVAPSQPPRVVVRPQPKRSEVQAFLPPVTFPMTGAGPVPQEKTIKVIRGSEVQEVSVDH